MVAGARTLRLGTKPVPLYTPLPTGDYFDFANAPGPVSISKDAVANDGLPGEGDNVGNQADRIYGSPFADRIDLSTEQAGGVLVAGLGGDDEIIGSAHTDSLAGDEGADRVSGGGGEDHEHRAQSGGARAISGRAAGAQEQFLRQGVNRRWYAGGGTVATGKPHDLNVGV